MTDYTSIINELKAKGYIVIPPQGTHGLHSQAYLGPVPIEMSIGKGRTVKVGSTIIEDKYGTGTVISFYGYDSMYCLDVRYADGKIASHHPSMFPDQFKLLDEI